MDSVYSLIGAGLDYFVKTGEEMPGAKIDKLTKMIEKKIREIEAVIF